MVKKYKPNSAASKMVTNVLIVTSEKTIDDVKLHLANKKKKYSFMDYGYVVDSKNKLIGCFSVGDLFRYKSDSKIKKIMKKEIVSVSPDVKDETAAHLAINSEIKAIPVVKNGKLLGVIPAKTILRIMHKSSQEDFLRMAGIDSSHMEYEDSMKIPVLRSVSHRISWLIIGLLGIMLAAGIINAFEEALESHMILAYFIPAILYLAGALSAQLVTLCVRDLAHHGKKLKKIQYLLKQSIIATILGFGISIVTFIVVSLIWREPYIGFVISLALFIATIITNLTSLLITLMLDKLGKDPGLGSGPFATVVADVTAIFIYLAVASMMLL